VATDLGQETAPADRGVTRKVAWNSQAVLLSFVFRAASGVGVVVLLARDGGPRSLGVVQFALTLSALLPFYYGIPSLLAREVARRPEDGRRWVEVGLLLSILFGGLFLVLLPVGTWVVGASPETVWSIAIATVGMVFDGIGRVPFAAFWAWERMGLEALVTGGQEACYLGATVAVLAAGGGPLAVLGAFAASRAVGAVWGWLIVGRRLGGLPLPRAERAFFRSTVRSCTPFAIGDTLTLTYARFDSVLLGIWKGPASVGLYQAATNLVLYFNTVARSINRALFPRMGRAWPDHRDEFGRLRDLSLRLIAFLAVPITVGSLLLAPRTIEAFYGPAFAPVVLTYQLLIVVIPVRMAANTMSLSLAATDRQTPRTIAVSAAAVLNIGLNCWFIPRWSYLGAAMTTVICETLLLLAYATLLRRVSGGSELLRSNGWPLVAALPMAAVVLLTADQPVFVSAAAGAVTYALAVAVLALLRSPAYRRRPARAFSALVRPGR
jgi:O-antigen/teichoic acid export membrane protein